METATDDLCEERKTSAEYRKYKKNHCVLGALKYLFYRDSFAGVECYICFKLFDNLDQKNKCLIKHFVCHSCLSKWIYKHGNDKCPVCRSLIWLDADNILREDRYSMAAYREYKNYFFWYRGD